MSRDFSLSHLSLLPIGPPDLIDFAADAGARHIRVATEAFLRAR